MLLPPTGSSPTGSPLPRLEDERLLRGRGHFTDDVMPDDCGHAAFVRSDRAHAGIVSVDATAARLMPGVRLALTGADVAREGLGPLRPMAEVPGQKTLARPVMARDEVRHVGEIVAMVVADAPDQARDAAEAVGVELLPRPPVEETAYEWRAGDAPAVERALATAHRVVRLETASNRLIVHPLEMRCAVGWHDAPASRYTLHSPTQGAHQVRSALSDQVFGIPTDHVRVVTEDVGGAFGMKLHTYPEQALVLLAARLTRAPVRWTASRSEGSVSDAHGRAQHLAGELAVDAEGQFLGLRVRNVADLGAYYSNFGPPTPSLSGGKVLGHCYRIPAIDLGVRAVLTNTVPVDAYRGAGKPEMVFLLERLIDEAAVALGIDRIEIRRRNLLRPADLPYRLPLGQEIDTGDFPTILDEVADKADWRGLEARRAASEAKGLRRGIGVGLHMHVSGGFTGELSLLRVDPDGSVIVHTGTQTGGQGHETVFAQIVAERLGIDAGKVIVRQGDTDALERGGGTGGSSSLPIAGVNIARATELLIDKGKRLAADRLEAAVADVSYGAGVFAVVGTDRRVGLFELATSDDLSAGCDFEGPNATFPNGAYVVEVEVDFETGAVSLCRFTGVDDLGRVINPMIAQGQIHGGIVQAFGQALMEEAVYDETRQLLSATLTDYALPRADDLPELASMTTSFHPVPATANSLGVKGAGELGPAGGLAPVVNAVLDALRPLGVERLDMPLTPLRIWRSIEEARDKRGATASVLGRPESG